VAESIPLHQKLKGALQEKEDWWRLIIQDDGDSYVEHEWSHVDAYRDSKPDSGTRRVPIDDFLAGDEETAAQDALRKVLSEREGK
jgi:hypothetical protein